MSTRARALAVCLLTFATLGLLTPAPAHAAGYSIFGIATTAPAACANALAAVEAHCDIHGVITTESLGCFPLYNGRGEYLGILCRCEGSTPLCLRAFPAPHFP